IERLREVRLMVQPIADGRPTAQLALGRLLRDATNIVEPPTFDATAQTRLAAGLDAPQAWGNETTRLAAHKPAPPDRRRGKDWPSVEDLQTYIGENKELATLVVPKEDAVQAATTLPALQEVDDQVARVLLACRDHEADWYPLLFKAIASHQPLNDLFDIVD